MRKVYLVCGVSGSGKTWVCTQAGNKYDYVAHDEYFDKEDEYLQLLTEERDKPVLTECPFGERPFRAKLEFMGAKVIPVFVFEAPETVRNRYLSREGKAPKQNVLTRAKTIMDRAKEWNAMAGSSKEVLEYLKTKV